jgi:hypothetical protein
MILPATRLLVLEAIEAERKREHANGQEQPPQHTEAPHPREAKTKRCTRLINTRITIKKHQSITPISTIDETTLKKVM